MASSSGLQTRHPHVNTSTSVIEHPSATAPIQNETPVQLSLVATSENENSEQTTQTKKKVNSRGVTFDEETMVDNENMGKKSSKCCCVYEKPLAFGESSSEDEDDCRGCRGHNHKNKKKHEQEPQHPGSNDMTHGSTNCPDNSQIGSSGT